MKVGFGSSMANATRYMGAAKPIVRMLSPRRASVSIPKFVNLAARSHTNFGFGALTLLSLVRAQLFDRAELFHPPLLHHLAGARHRKRALRHVFHDHRTGSDIGTL